MIESYLTVRERLIRKIKVLSEIAWDRRCEGMEVQRWLQCFDGRTGLAAEEESVQMLFLLSNFLYFGEAEVKELLRALYRDLFRYRIVSAIRRENGDGGDDSLLRHQFTEELSRTIFLAEGGSEASSGPHLLYPFRQVNDLRHKNFLSPKRSLTERVQYDTPRVKHCVFLDDFSGSGQQAMDYAAKAAAQVLKIRPDVNTYLFFLVATEKSLHRIRKDGCFTHVDCVLELAEDFRAFSKESLYYIDPPEEIVQKLGQKVAKEYGQQLEPSSPLGFKNGQLLLGFEHNTPNNTIPILRSRRAGWKPPFPRKRST
ncbi:MAG: hypothetical protein F4X81_09475 [Gammaproteobacteria bacterium]|nr:hypothetical protein [Gammaproteobacteria bacterium]MYE51687.1 hypothetical protein [Gammaproteobacteria bacterium]MYF10947.1 hypothetical protein [Gammaproteobacteria bacterium]MYH17353.1 hypothetical protein [Gammaproteobacteria bacterium]